MNPMAHPLQISGVVFYGTHDHPILEGVTVEEVVDAMAEPYRAHAAAVAAKQGLTLGELFEQRRAQFAAEKQGWQDFLVGEAEEPPPPLQGHECGKGIDAWVACYLKHCKASGLHLFLDEVFDVIPDDEDDALPGGVVYTDVMCESMNRLNRGLSLIGQQADDEDWTFHADYFVRRRAAAEAAALREALGTAEPVKRRRL